MSSKRKAPPTAEQEAIKPAGRVKGWGPEVRALSDKALIRELYRLYCLDSGLEDPLGTYTVEEHGGHRFLRSKQASYVSQYKSKATYSVFQDYRWFKATYPVYHTRMVESTGAPLEITDRFIKALAAFRSYVRVGAAGKGEVALRHHCSYGIKKAGSSTGGADSQRVCFAAQCLIETQPGDNPRVMNEIDKHFHYFLHHPDKKIEKAAREAFSKGGILGRAYKSHFNMYYQ
jgi:hypothetical protein